MIFHYDYWCDLWAQMSNWCRSSVIRRWDRGRRLQMWKSVAKLLTCNNFSTIHITLYHKLSCVRVFHFSHLVCLHRCLSLSLSLWPTLRPFTVFRTFHWRCWIRNIKGAIATVSGWWPKLRRILHYFFLCLSFNEAEPHLTVHFILFFIWNM